MTSCSFVRSCITHLLQGPRVIMENQMEKNTENEMETGIIGFRGGNIGAILVHVGIMENGNRGL